MAHWQQAAVRILRLHMALTGLPSAARSPVPWDWGLWAGPDRHASTVPLPPHAREIRAWLDHHQRSIVDSHRWPYHRDAGALSILNVNAAIIHHDHGSGSILEDDAPSKRSGCCVAQ